MPQLVENHATYSDLINGQDTTSTNNTGRDIRVCDCCGPRRVFKTLAAADAHEAHQADHTSLSECGIYPDDMNGEYAPGVHRPQYRRADSFAGWDRG